MSSNLQQNGFRFIFRDGRYTWMWPELMIAGDVDCTDMDDSEFENFVMSMLGEL